jgi:hypothetical protein
MSLTPCTLAGVLSAMEDRLKDGVHQRLGARNVTLFKGLAGVLGLLFSFLTSP